MRLHFLHYFVPMFTPVSTITTLSLACLVAPIPSTFVSPNVTSSLPSLESSFASPNSEKAFIVGPGHAPIPVSYTHLTLPTIYSV